MGFLWFGNHSKNKARDLEIALLNQDNLKRLTKSNENLKEAQKSQKESAKIQKSVTEQLWIATGGKTR